MAKTLIHLERRKILETEEIYSWGSIRTFLIAFWCDKTIYETVSDPMSDRDREEHSKNIVKKMRGELDPSCEKCLAKFKKGY